MAVQDERRLYCNSVVKGKKAVSPALGQGRLQRLVRRGGLIFLRRFCRDFRRSLAARTATRILQTIALAARLQDVTAVRQTVEFLDQGGIIHRCRDIFRRHAFQQPGHQRDAIVLRQ